MSAFVRTLWASARRPAVAKRCLRIALVVGTVLSLVNQWDALSAPVVAPTTWVRVVANYVIPFIVSNLGAMASLAAESRAT